MSALGLTLATGPAAFLGPLRRGDVRATGLDLRWLDVPCALRHRRLLRHGVYDGGEFSLGAYLAARSRGDRRLVAIPHISRRAFPHRFVVVRGDAGWTDAAALVGRRIGLLSHQNSMAIYAKAALARAAGVAPEAFTWVTVRPERVPMMPPPSREEDRSGRSAEALLVAGEVDAIVVPDLPASVAAGDGRLVRLFADPEGVERAWVEETGHVPLMHVTVLRRQVVEAHPWVPTALLDALLASQRRHERDRDADGHGADCVWPPHEAERQRFGGTPFPQGLRGIRSAIQGVIELARAQGLLDGPLGPEELFDPSTLDS